MISEKPSKFTYIILLFFAIIYSLISLVNHYNFRTYAWDLGINNNAIYDYAHFQWNDCMLMQPQFSNVLSDHLSLFPVLISPFYWILGSYTMLIFQIIAILFGGYGIYCYFREKVQQQYIPELAMFHFFTAWGIYSALGFDYHDNVIGAMFVPWFFYFFEKSNWKYAVLFFVLIVISKENMALWATFLALGLLLLNWKDKKKMKHAFLFSAGAGIYFLLVVKLIMPSLANEGREYLHFKYDALGKDFREAFITILTRPQYAFSLLFENHLNDPVANGIKSELHFMILLSGGFALFIRPQYLLMLLPIYAQKLFNDDFGKWGLNYQYSIEFAPIITIALFQLIINLKSNKKIFPIAAIVVAVTSIATISKLDNRVSKWYEPEQVRFYSTSHYTTNYNVQKIYAALDLIPANAKVSAQGQLVPHLCFRDFIYQYPVVQDAEYIVLLNKGKTYPLTQEEFNFNTAELLHSDTWSTVYNESDIYIFKHN